MKFISHVFENCLQTSSDEFIYVSVVNISMGVDNAEPSENSYLLLEASL